MHIHFGFDIVCEFPAATPLILLLHTRPSFTSSLLRPQILRNSAGLPVDPFVDPFGNLATRMLAPAGSLRLHLDSLCEVSGEPDEIDPGASQGNVARLPVWTYRYLLPSRYCESDRLSGFAWAQFGSVPAGWARVQAVVDYVHNHLSFAYPLARPHRTAYEAWLERTGVCRDFAHLSIALCRALNIPARYTTGYLGDIGVPPVPDPMDFSAWFEVYLGKRWYTFDPRHNARRIGRIVMAYGRDAADCALITSFGPHTLSKFHVVTEEVGVPAPRALAYA